MPLFTEWCQSKRTEKQRKRYWLFTEMPKGRDIIRAALFAVIRDHYDSSANIAGDIESLGYGRAAALLRERLPRTKKARSGELGEILATELVIEEMGFRVPVRRLRYKDQREVALRGDDFIGVALNKQGGLLLLKGEAKSRANLTKTTIGEARTVLMRDDGRCTPSSLLFVADRLMERDGEDAKLGRAIRNEVGLKTLGPSRIDHVLFTLSGNAPPAALKEDLEAADAGRGHAVVNLQIQDHQDFIAEAFEGAGKLGNS